MCGVLCIIGLRCMFHNHDYDVRVHVLIEQEVWRVTVVVRRFLVRFLRLRVSPIIEQRFE